MKQPQSTSDPHRIPSISGHQRTLAVKKTEPLIGANRRLGNSPNHSRPHRFPGISGHKRPLAVKKTGPLIPTNRRL
jgi:hypothetical protein